MRIITTMLLFSYFLTLLAVPRPGEFETGTRGLPTPAFEALYNWRDPVVFDSMNVNFTGNWPQGSSYSISKSPSAGLVFAGSGGSVFVLDTSDENNPVTLSEIRARSLVDQSWYDESTQRLFLAAYFSGIEVWDVADPAQPFRITRIPTEPYPRAGVWVNGNYLYAVTVAYGMFTWDISDIQNPQPVSSLHINDTLWNAEFRSDYAFLGGNSAIHIVDMANPAEPVLATTYPASSGNCDIEGDVLYIPDSGYGLRLVDISDPTNPQNLGSLQIAGSCRAVDVENGVACVANSFNGNGGGVWTIDVQNPASPQQSGWYEAYYSDLVFLNNTVYTTGGAEGIGVLDVSDPASPQPVYSIPLANFVDDVEVHGDLAFTGSNGFRVFDLSNPSYPEQIGYNDIPGALVEYAGDDLVLYCPKSMGAPNRVNVMDVSDPANPVRSGYLQCPAMTYDLYLQGNFAYVACWWDGLRIIDFSNPDAPVLASHVLGWQNDNSVPGEDYCFAQAVAVQGDYAYVIDYQPFDDQDTRGLYVIDISDPYNPVVVNRYPFTTGSSWDIDVYGHLACIADADGGVEIIDITHPMYVYTEEWLPLEDSARGVFMDAYHCYVANYIYGGVKVIELGNLNRYEVVDWYKRSGCFALDVIKSDSLLYVADGPCGFQVYHHWNNPIDAIPDAVPPALSMNATVYPNPFNPETQIRFTLQHSDHVRVDVFNIRGQHVCRLLDAVRPAGINTIVWKADDQSSGVYLVRVSSSGRKDYLRAMLLK